MNESVTGNETIKQFWEDFYSSSKIGPNSGMYLCDRDAVPSGPHYLIFFYCPKYLKEENGHMELDSGVQ